MCKTMSCALQCQVILLEAIHSIIKKKSSIISLGYVQHSYIHQQDTIMWKLGRQCFAKYTVSCCTRSCCEIYWTSKSILHKSVECLLQGIPCHDKNFPDKLCTRVYIQRVSESCFCGGANSRIHIFCVGNCGRQLVVHYSYTTTRGGLESVSAWLMHAHSLIGSSPQIYLLIYGAIDYQYVVFWFLGGLNLTRQCCWVPVDVEQCCWASVAVGQCCWASVDVEQYNVVEPQWM